MTEPRRLYDARVNDEDESQILQVIDVNMSQVLRRIANHLEAEDMWAYQLRIEITGVDGIE